MGADFDAWLATPPPKAEPVRPRLMASVENPRSSDPLEPRLVLEESEWFDLVDPLEDRKVQIREVIMFKPNMPLTDDEFEIRGYGAAYLKNGRTFAARGEAQFILITHPPTRIRERLIAEWNRLHPA